MRRSANKVHFQVSAAICLSCALLLLILPLKWFAAAASAAFFHELCHWTAVKLCGGKILRIIIGGNGAVMEVEPMGPGRELVCSLAGPAGGLILLLLSRWLPRTAVCAAFHSVYNLLPVFPLDGGRALRCGAALFLSPSSADMFCNQMERFCKAALVLLGIYGTFILQLGLLPIALSVLILIKTSSVKIPCKPGLQEVQ